MPEMASDHTRQSGKVPVLKIGTSTRPTFEAVPLIDVPSFDARVGVGVGVVTDDRVHIDIIPNLFLTN